MILCQEGGKQIVRVLKNAGKSTKRLSDEDDFHTHTERRRRRGIIMKTGGAHKTVLRKYLVLIMFCQKKRDVQNKRIC